MSTRWLDYGPDHYATVSFHAVEPALLLGWMNNWDYARQVPTTPWRGAMTLPRHLGLVDTPRGLRATLRPTDTLRDRRRDRIGLAAQTPLRRDRAPLELELELASGGDTALRFLNEEGDVLQVSIHKATVEIDRSHARSRATMLTTKARAPRTGLGGPVRVIVDRSSLEVFADHGTTVLSALYFIDAPFDRIALEGAANGTLWSLA